MAIADGKRRFDCYATEADALDAANTLARQLSERDVVAAAMTNEQAADYAAAVGPFKAKTASRRVVARASPRRTRPAHPEHARKRH